MKTLRLRDAKASLSAVIEAAETRLRPILMTGAVIVVLMTALDASDVLARLDPRTDGPVVLLPKPFDLPALLKKFPGMKTASLGPETSKAIEALGLKPVLEAKPHTIDGLVEALLKAKE